MLSHVGSRVKISGGGMMIGSQGGPTVVYTSPFALVPVPNPKDGHCKSAIVNGFASPTNPFGPS